MTLRRYAAVILLSLSLLAPSTALAQTPAPPDANDPIARIKDEGLNHSQVMQTLSYLSDVIGPRLTASPNMKRANEWTRDQLTKWGLQNARLESWGPFGRGWSLKRFSAQVIEPQTIPLIAYPKAWSPALASPLTAEVVYVDATDEAGLQKFKGQLQGKIVLTAPVHEVKAHFEALGTRRDDKNLLALADAPEPPPNPRGGAGGGGGRARSEEFRLAQQFTAAKYLFFQSEGAALLVDPSRTGDGGTIFVQSATVPQPPAPGRPGPGAPRQIQAYDKNAGKIPPQLVLSIEHYNRIVRMIQADQKVKMSVDLAVEWQDADPMGYNTIAEIPGSDLPDEVVMIGGHMDSWHAGTGATDNGAGVAVAMEAVRILQTLGLKPRRTIRVGLWTGEEEGLLGSAAYVTQHFGKREPGNPGVVPPGTPNSQPAAPDKLVTLPEYDKLSAYYNLDNGADDVERSVFG